MNRTYTAASGTTYSYDLERQTRTAYAEYMNPASKYERVYFQVNVYGTDGNRLNFAFVDDENDTDAIHAGIDRVDEWVHTPDDVLASMHSARD
jgi:hypothetical protein